MINSKLTLKLSTNSIARAKAYSENHKISLLSLVEKYFDELTLPEQEIKYSPIVQELAGIISLTEDYDYKSDYSEHLEKKYE